MDKDKMLNILISLVNECWWIGTKEYCSKTSKVLIERKLNQLSKGLGHGKLSPEELRKITCYVGGN